ncbi:MAG: C39 family peptidase [Dorea sp.]
MEPMKKESFAKRRRRRQVHRQLVILGMIALGILIAAIGYKFLREKQEKEAKEAVRIEQEKQETLKKQAASQNKENQETEEQRLERVRTQAKERGYPAGVIELLDKNPKTVDFVEDYEEKKNEPYAETIGDQLKEGEIPLLLQWDERWGYAPYGTSIVAVSGCGPTCMAMVASGLNQDPSITPDKVAAYGTEHGYVDEDNNTYWAFMKEAGKNWNLSCYEGNLTEEQVSRELVAGHPIICSVGPGDFTKIGHFIVLTGYENGSVTVNDPFSQENSDKSWKFTQIQDQIKAMWVYSKK